MTEPSDGAPFDPDAILAEYDHWVADDDVPLGSDTPPANFGPLDKERKWRYHALSDDDKQPYRELADYFLNMVDAKTIYGHQIPGGMIAAAMEKTGWARRTVQRRKKEFAAYLQRNLEGQETDQQRIEQGAPFFVHLPRGREKGQNTLSQDLKHVIIYAVLHRTRVTRTTHNTYRKHEIEFSFLEVYRFAKAVFTQQKRQSAEDATELHASAYAARSEETDSGASSEQYRADLFPSYDTVRRFIQFLMEKMPALFVWGTVGRREVEAKLLLKRANDVPAPNVRWQSDVIDFQLYVVHNEQVRPVSLLIIYDDHSRSIVWWTLFFREAVRDPNTGRLKKSYVDSRTVSTSFATAMYVSRCRCWIFYTDHGSYYERSEKGFYVLTDDNEPEVAVSNTRHGRPEGRGKSENILGKTEQGLVSRFPSRYKDRSEIKAAQEKAVQQNVTYEEVRDELKEHFDRVNNKPFRKNGTQTRFEVWRSVASLEAPPIRRLAHLPDIDSRDETVTIRNNWVVSFLGGEWEPRETDAHVYRRWADFVAQKASVRIVAVRLDIGWVAEVCLDAEQDEWLEMVPKASLPTEVTEHNEAQQGALKTMQTELTALVEQGEEVIQRQGGMPVMGIASGDYEEKVTDADARVRKTRPARRRTSGAATRKAGRDETAETQRARPAPAAPAKPDQAAPVQDAEEDEPSLAAIWAAQQAQRKQEES